MILMHGIFYLIDKNVYKLFYAATDKASLDVNTILSDVTYIYSKYT